MSLRFFVSSCSILLVAWLVLAFVSPVAVKRGADPVEGVVDAALSGPDEIKRLTVSVSP